MTRRRISATERQVIFERAAGLCHICGYAIDPVRDRYEIEHVIARALGGDEAKGSDNLQPAHTACHRAKTSRDVGSIAKAKRVRYRHTGSHQPKSRLPGGRGSKWKRRVSGEVVLRDGN